MRFDIDLGDIDELLEKINASERLRARGGAVRTAGSRVYADEPIIRRGSQMSNYLPEPVRRMRDLARTPEARNWTDARLFLEQGRLMADYEDDYPYHGSFQSYFPTYDTMDNAQLRGYFSWRTQVRDGLVGETSASFAYVYVYELLNGIGVEPGVRGFKAIEAFWQAYRQFEPGMDRYVRAWLVDYVAWHGLDPKLARPYLSLGHDRAVEVLRAAQAQVLAQPQNTGRKRVATAFDAAPVADPALFDALNELSTYRLTGSRFYKDAPDDLRLVCCAVFCRLARYYKGGRTQPLVESLFGTRHESVHLMFASAVFYPGARHADCTVALDPTCSYRCERGLWYKDALRDGSEKSAKLGEALRAVDRRLREAVGFPHALKEHGEPRYLLQIVDREVADYLEWKRAHEARRVTIDLSKLAGIRSAAAETCESLLVDEEREEEPTAAGVPATEAAAEAPTLTATPVPAAPFSLTKPELALLQGLLAGQTTPSGADLLVDSVNEKLFDLLGDVALEFGADGLPELVPDYADDLREALLP